MELEVAASLESMKAVFEDMTAVDQFWKSCTDKNMSEVRILNGEGLTVGTYKDMCLMSLGVYFGQNRRWKDHGNIWYS